MFKRVSPERWMRARFFRVLPLVAVLVSACLLRSASGVERFPPPDFDPGYRMPVTAQNPPLAAWREYVDVSLLLLGLATASWLALRRRSRAGLLALSVAALVWFGFVRQGCVCPIGAIQNVVLGLVDRTFVVPLGVLAFLLLPLVFTLFFGRTYCSSVCPHGALQDLVLLHPVRLPRWLTALLGLFPHVYLGLAVLLAATGSVFIVCKYDPFVALFRMTGSREMLMLGALFIFAAMFIGRPYCRFACPLGAVFGWLSKLSWRHVTITPDECIHCRLCEDECPFDAIRKPLPVELSHNRTAGKVRLAVLVLLMPVLVGVGAWAGHRAGPVLAAHTDRTVQLALDVQQSGLAKGATPPERAVVFKASGASVIALEQSARDKLRAFRLGGAVFGGYLGLVFGGILIGFTTRRPQPDYVPDRAGCVSCGRCYMTCPREWVRLGRPMEDGGEAT